MEFAIGSRLKELRKTKGMSISELAERSGVSTGLISQIERDLVVPSVVNLYRVARTPTSTTSSRPEIPGRPGSPAGGTTSG